MFPRPLYPRPQYPTPLYPGTGKGSAPVVRGSQPFPSPLFPGALFPAPLFSSSGKLHQVITPQLGRDRPCYLDAVKRMLAIPEFGGTNQYGRLPPVQYGRSLEHILEGGDHKLVAVVNPLFYKIDDKYDPIAVLRKVTGSIAVAVRHEDAEDRQATLDLIDAKIHNVIDGQSLFGITLPGMTAIVAGQYRDASHPEQRLILQLEFAYFVEGFDQNDETEEPIGY